MPREGLYLVNAGSNSKSMVRINCQVFYYWKTLVSFSYASNDAVPGMAMSGDGYLIWSRIRKKS